MNQKWLYDCGVRLRSFELPDGMTFTLEILGPVKGMTTLDNKDAIDIANWLLEQTKEVKQ